ncbi:hypothetical protein SASPL_114225 [Salvia splendens]|uniref:TF-B3 domain-containing protein n=1 Tax=Salvia splendens TaxID=180675 RepID=A0A8X9A072_SALSN|nr:hypothetical protein SASPL_114225 [Salvia splendens]
MAGVGMQPMPNGGLPFLRCPSFLKVFSRVINMDESEIPVEFDVVYETTLHADCRLVMPNGVDNLLKDDDSLIFIIADVGIFHVKRYDVHTDVPPLTDGEDYADVPDEGYPADRADKSDDFKPSDSDTDSTDGSGYEDDQHALDLDGRPTFDVTITTAHLSGTFMIPYGFWSRHIPMGALQAPMYFLTTDNTWPMSLMHTDSMIWVKHGWKQFRRSNGLVVGDCLHFTLVNPLEVTFYVWVEKA